MIHHAITQGSELWHDIRSVIPTASNFDRLLTPATWVPTRGETRRNFQLELLANRIFGISPGDQFSSSAMDHGREWEPIARAAYEFERDVEIEEGGFFTDDSESYGASPDGLVGADGLVEFKNPEGPTKHLSALMDDLEYAKRPADWTAAITKGSEVTGFVREHWAQVQGQLYVTERQWCDLICNFSRLPMVVVRIYRNPVYLGLLSAALESFCFELTSLVVASKERGWYKQRRPVVVPDGLDALGISDDDVEAIIKNTTHAG